MTYEQAYAEGFCKAAEAAGVDPSVLVKRAQLMGKLVGAARGAGKAIKGGAKRYLELLRGGNDKIINPDIPLRDSTLLNILKMRGKRTIGIRTSPEIKNELRKSLAVQAGTGLGLAGAGTALATRDSEPQSAWDRLAAKLKIGK